MGKISIVEDLATIHPFFAELYVEKGINVFPEVCDEMDDAFFEISQGELRKNYNLVNENLVKLINDLSQTDTDEEIKENLIERKNLINDELEKMNAKDYDFLQTYQQLKKIQNKLGISVSSRCLNIIQFCDKNFDAEKIAEQIVGYSKARKNFIKAGEDLARSNGVIKTKEQQLSEVMEIIKNLVEKEGLELSEDEMKSISLVLIGKDIKEIKKRVKEIADEKKAEKERLKALQNAQIQKVNDAKILKEQKQMQEKLAKIKEKQNTTQPTTPPRKTETQKDDKTLDM